jgi:hypothetical protein
VTRIELQNTKGTSDDVIHFNNKTSPSSRSLSKQAVVGRNLHPGP